MTDVWKIHSIERVPDGNTPFGGGTEAGNEYLTALTSVGFPVNANVVREVAAGDIFPTTGRIDLTSVDLQFTTSMARKAIEIMQVTGVCIEPGGDTYNIYVAQYGCAGPLAGASHRRYTITKGVLYMTSMNTAHRGDTQVSAVLKAVYDGANDPVTVTDNVLLPTPAVLGDRNGRWTLHDSSKSEVNDVAINDKQSINIDFGFNVTTKGADSTPFDTFAGIQNSQPVVTIQGNDLKWFDTLGLTIKGKAVTHANTRFALRKRDGAGGFIDDAVAEHIVVTANGPAYYSDLLSGSADDPATTSVRIEPIEDNAGNAPLIITTGVVA